MAAHIDDVTIKPVRLTPTEAELAVEVTYSAAPPTCELHGRLMAASCGFRNVVTAPAAFAAAAWDYGDRAGLLIVTDQSVRVDTVRHPSALGWMSNGEMQLN